MSDQEKDALIRELIQRVSQAGAGRGMWGNIPEWVKIVVVVAGAIIGSYVATQQSIASLKADMAGLNANFMSYKEWDSKGADNRETRLKTCENDIGTLKTDMGVNKEQIQKIEKKIGSSGSRSY